MAKATTKKRENNNNKKSKKSLKKKKQEEEEEVQHVRHDDEEEEEGLNGGEEEEEEKHEKKEKRSKKSLKKKKQQKKEEVHVQYDDDDDVDEDEGLNGGEEEKEEEEDDDERRRNKLLEAIAGLGAQKKRKRPLVERSEAAVLMSEFTVGGGGGAGGEEEEGGGGGAEGGGVQLSDLIGSLEQTPAVSSRTKKQLKNLQRGKALETPLSRQEAQRIQRGVAFHKASQEVTRWSCIIQENQRAEQLVFPLNQDAPPAPKTIERRVRGWKARTPLEQEVFALLTANKQPIHDPVLTSHEEASLRAMSLEEAKIRRAELQKARALQSYYEARTRREKKIKSKKYHRVQNKAKRKEVLKKFDDMVKEDPAGALEELKKIEEARMKERMTLKHQNSGKWAKSKAIMAKYDLGARRAMQEQLEVNKELTQKMVTSLSKEEEEEEEEEEKEEEEVPDFVNDAEGAAGSSNPWMRGRLTEEPVEKEEKETEEVIVVGGGEKEEEEEEVLIVETEEEALLREFDSRRKRRQAQEEGKDGEEEEQQEEEERKDGEEEEKEEEERKDGEEVQEKEEKQDEKEEEKEEQQDEEEEEKEEEEEEEELSEFTSLYRDMTDRQEAPDTSSHLEEAPDTSPQLEEGLQRIRTLEDVDLLSPEADVGAEKEPQQPPPPAPPAPPKLQNKKRKRGIELKEVLTKGAKVIQVPLAPTMQAGEEEEDQQEEQQLDQRGLIMEAFAGDDVVSDFLKEKRAQEEASRPKVVDLTLPGWGEWGGTGLKPSRQKRKKFRVKAAAAAAPPTRRDSGLPSVMVTEKRSSSLSLHQVSSLPQPFITHAQFEGSIRVPLGRAWNTEKTVKKATKPRVVTRPGAIIEPMRREELMKKRRKTMSGAVDWKREHH
ncbi:U3 small nucleolar RNA-associated protein 14 homolog A [Scomber scombrus]|uniref:U3 small nucleolar RNA-associated protein 14 homolog A n=1 Tax=Scomber scombrus TaxID=13677 RepID=A0AAV1QLS8_SCOSC